jgi:hypothetical protein
MRRCGGYAGYDRLGYFQSPSSLSLFSPDLERYKRTPILPPYNSATCNEIYSNSKRNERGR